MHDSEIHCTFFWIWDLGFNFRIGAIRDDIEVLAAADDNAVTEYLLMMNYRDLDEEIKRYIEEAGINDYKVEEVASALAYVLYKMEGGAQFMRWYRAKTAI